MSDSFVLNVADAPAAHHLQGGWTVPLEPRHARFESMGINIRVLDPDQPNGKYHSDTLQEDFLVLGGERIVLLDDDCGREFTRGQAPWPPC